jgi:hypothetical protein
MSEKQPADIDSDSSYYTAVSSFADNTEAVKETPSFTKPSAGEVADSKPAADPKPSTVPDTTSVVSDISLDKSAYSTDSAGAIVDHTTHTRPKNPSTPPVGAKRKRNQFLKREGVHELVPLGFKKNWVANTPTKGRPGGRIKRAKIQVYVPEVDYINQTREYIPVQSPGSISDCSDIGVSVQHRCRSFPTATKLAAKCAPTDSPPVKTLWFERDPLQYRLVFDHRKEPFECDEENIGIDYNPESYFEYYKNQFFHYS